MSSAAEVERTVLALYDSSESPADKSNIHNYLEMPLNRAGLLVKYHDVQVRPLPDPARYRGIALWFTDNRMVRHGEYLSWLRKALASGTRFLMIDGTGAALDEDGEPTSAGLEQAILGQIGVRQSDRVASVENPFVINFNLPEKKLFGYEVKFDVARPYYTLYETVKSDVRPWVVMSRSDVPKSDSVVVAETSRGV
jgi:hypothetical protein